MPSAPGGGGAGGVCGEDSSVGKKSSRTTLDAGAQDVPDVGGEHMTVADLGFEMCHAPYMPGTGGGGGECGVWRCQAVPMRSGHALLICLKSVRDPWFTSRVSPPADGMSTARIAVGTGEVRGDGPSLPVRPYARPSSPPSSTAGWPPARPYNRAPVPGHPYPCTPRPVILVHNGIST